MSTFSEQRDLFSVFDFEGYMTFQGISDFKKGFRF